MNPPGDGQAGGCSQPVEATTSQNRIRSISTIGCMLEQCKIIVQRRRAYFDDVEWVEGMDLTYTFPAKKLDGMTIDTAVLTILLAELAPAVSEDPSGFKLDEFLKEDAAFGPPKQQGIVLTQR